MGSCASKGMMKQMLKGDDHPGKGHGHGHGRRGSGSSHGSHGHGHGHGGGGGTKCFKKLLK